MESGKYLVLLLVCIAIPVLSCGCTGTAPRPHTTVPGEIALGLSDLPEGYTVSAKGEVPESEIPPEYRNTGLRDGYMVTYCRISNATDLTGISQVIATFSPSGKDIILSALSGAGGTRGQDDMIVKDLPDPGIGEYSRAYEVTSREGSLVAVRFYVISFVKGDVFETIAMTGTATDPELLMELARLAATKIA